MFGEAVCRTAGSARMLRYLKFAASSFRAKHRGYRLYGLREPNQ